MCIRDSYYFTAENEGPRLHDEEFGALDFEPVLFPWWADDTAATAAKLAGGPLGSDSPGAATQVSLASLRASLSETEIARYRWLGAETAAATVEALHQVEPGLSEYDLEAITEQGLLRRGILPSVALYAVDERIYKYKHAVPRGARLKQYGMLNLCSRKWGLAISITRFIHFGAVPADLADKFRIADVYKRQEYVQSSVVGQRFGWRQRDREPLHQAASALRTGRGGLWRNPAAD